MTPGPTIIRKCSACGKLIAEHTIDSGNTFGARFWTDGKRDAPMLPDAPWLVKCAHCAALVWIDEQEQVGKVEPWGLLEQYPAEFKDARSLETPSLEGYFAALSTPISDGQKERYIRLRAWWAGNDPRRETDQAGPMSDQEIANLRAFLSFLDEADENDRIMKAEALRELRMFTEAKAVLSGSFSDDLAQAAAIIKGLAEHRVAIVQKMKFEYLEEVMRRSSAGCGGEEGEMAEVAQQRFCPLQ